MIFLLLWTTVAAQTSYEDGLDLLQYANKMVVAEPVAQSSPPPRDPPPQQPPHPQLICRTEFLKLTKQMSESSAPHPRFALSKLTSTTSSDINYDISYILKMILDQFIESCMNILGPDIYFLLMSFKKYFSSYIPALADFFRKKSIFITSQD